jgi:hypothetical protein
MVMFRTTAELMGIGSAPTVDGGNRARLTYPYARGVSGDR